MTTARYLITSNDSFDDAPYIVLYVQDREALATNPDFVFVDTMSRCSRLGNALSDLLGIEIDGKRIFEPHLGYVEFDYSVECMFAGETELGALPPTDRRLFSVNTDSRTVGIGDGNTARLDRDCVQTAVLDIRHERTTRFPTL